MAEETFDGGGMLPDSRRLKSGKRVEDFLKPPFPPWPPLQFEEKSEDQQQLFGPTQDIKDEMVTIGDSDDERAARWQ